MGQLVFLLKVFMFFFEKGWIHSLKSRFCVPEEKSFLCLSCTFAQCLVTKVPRLAQNIKVINLNVSLRRESKSVLNICLLWCSIN